MFARKLFAQNARHVMHGGLGHGIGIGPIAHLTLPHHRAYIHHARRIIRAAGGDQHGQQLLCQVEHASDIDVHHLFPGRMGELAQRHTPSDARVVHQDVQLVRARLHLSDQRVDPFF